MVVKCLVKISNFTARIGEPPSCHREAFKLLALCDLSKSTSTLTDSIVRFIILAVLKSYDSEPERYTCFEIYDGYLSTTNNEEITIFFDLSVPIINMFNTSGILASSVNLTFGNLMETSEINMNYTVEFGSESYFDSSHIVLSDSTCNFTSLFEFGSANHWQLMAIISQLNSDGNSVPGTAGQISVRSEHLSDSRLLNKSQSTRRNDTFSLISGLSQSVSMLNYRQFNLIDSFPVGLLGLSAGAALAFFLRK